MRETIILDLAKAPCVTSLERGRLDAFFSERVISIDTTTEEKACIAAYSTLDAWRTFV